MQILVYKPKKYANDKISKVIKYPPVAQLDNAADSDSEDRGFESLRAGQQKGLHIVKSFLQRNLPDGK